MTTDRQLVFGDDGSVAADVVWAWISAHRWPGWRVSVVTAKASPSGASVLPRESTPRPWESTVTRRLPVGPEVTEVEFLTAEVDPRVLLSSFDGAALVAVGPRGHRALKQLHIGSTTEWLLHGPVAPLVIVRTPRPTQKILLCVDGSAHARKAAETVARLPWIGECDITILGVQAVHAEPEVGISHAAELLRPTGARLDERLIEAIPFTATFDVRSVILELIADEKPDLAALGTRGMGWMKRMLVGSTATAVAHHAPCSILVARDTSVVNHG